MNASWLIAVLLAAMASFISNLGVTLQKLHHLRIASDPRNSNAQDYHKGWMWRVGLFLVFFGSLADFAALSFGPQSLVAPLGSLTLVSNVIFAPLLLKETIGHWDVLATVLIVVGSSIAVIFGSHEAPYFTVFQLFSFFTRWDFILYALIVGTYIVMLYMSIQKIELIEKTEGVNSPLYLTYRGLHRFAYPSLSGAVGAQSVLLAKCFVELVGNTVRHWSKPMSSFDDQLVMPMPGMDGAMGGNGTELIPSELELYDMNNGGMSPNMFVHWQTYFVFAGMLVTIFAQIKYLNEGLKRFDASYSVPVFTSFWIILSVVSGMIFYREYRGMDTASGFMFAIGVAITVGGVITLGGREQAQPAQALPQEEEEDEEGGHGRARRHRGSSVDSSHLGASPADVRGDGSLNPAEPYDGYARGGRLPQQGAHGSGFGAKKGAAIGDRPPSPSQRSVNHNGLHDPELDLDLELDLEADSYSPSHSAHTPSMHVSMGATGSSSLSPASAPANVSAVDDGEGSVATGAKLVVLEASQRISAALNKLRGKAERDAIASIHSAVNAGSSPDVLSSHSALSLSSSSSSTAGASSSSGSLRAGRAHLPPDSEGATTEESAASDDDRDPLILKKKKAAARKAQQSVSNGSQQHRRRSSGGGLTLSSSSSDGPSRRSAGGTPTNLSLYDPTPRPLSVHATMEPTLGAPAALSASSSGSSADATPVLTRRGSEASATPKSAGATKKRSL